MKNSLFFCYSIIGFIFFPSFAGAQLPVCNGPSSGLVYYVGTSGSNIYNYDPSQPISTSNPVLNTISLPTNATQTLAVNKNLNATSPSPTFYTLVYDTFYYYNGTGWTSTGHSAGLGANIGGAGPYIYNMAGSSIILKYNGTANATSLMTIPTPSSCAFDVTGDSLGNLYLVNPQNTQWLKEFSSNGTLLYTWTMSGASSSFGGGGLATIGNNVYYNSSSGFWSGTAANGGITCTLVSSSAPIANAGDFASCPLSPLAAIYANIDTAYYCPGAASILLFASGGGTYTWTVLSGPATITGSGDSIYVTATSNSKIVLSASGTPSTDTITIIVPPAVVIGSNSPVCQGDSLHLTANGFSLPLTYQWHGPASFSDTAQNTYRANIPLADSGYYSLTETLHGCTLSDSVFVSVLPLPALPVASSNSPVCVGDTLKFGIGNLGLGISYSWTGPASYTAAGANPIRLNAQTAYTGIYTVTANLNGCSQSAQTNVAVNPQLGPPTINITTNPGDTVCTGQGLTLHATAGNAGSPTYQWKSNGTDISGATLATYVAGAVTNGEIFNCEVHSNLACQHTDSALSNSKTIHVITLAPPVISITAFPTVYTTGANVTFTGHVPTGNTGLTYSWTKNGVKINGATGISYATSNVSAGDTICFIAHRAVPCTMPDSSVACWGLALGVTSPGLSKGEVTVWPNPFSGDLSLSLLRQAQYDKGEGTARVYNAIGQLVYTSAVHKGVNVIDTRDFVAGVYVVQVTYSDGSKDVVRVVKE